MPFTNLELVEQVDAFPHPVYHAAEHAKQLSTLVRLTTAAGDTIGYLLPSVVAALKDTALSGSWWDIGDSITLRGNTIEERNENILKTVTSWRENKTFTVLSGWRNELYAVYAPAGQLYLTMERAATCLFGVVTYGVHMTVYTTNPLRIWVPRRNINKATYGGMLDNSVAGGIAAGMGAFETLVKEGAEEASLPEDLVRERAKCTGAATYFYVRDKRAGGEDGLLQPEVEYTYDMEVPEDVVLKPCDDEVQEFHLWDVEKVKHELAAGNFKPNCIMILLDFFIRHNIITPENEPDFLQISARIHRALEFPLASHALA